MSRLSVTYAGTHMWKKSSILLWQKSQKNSVVAQIIFSTTRNIFQNRGIGSEGSKVLIELTLGAGIGKGADDWVRLHKHSFYELKQIYCNFGNRYLRIWFGCINKLHRIQHSINLREWQKWSWGKKYWKMWFLSRQRWTRKLELLKEADFTQWLNCQCGLLLFSVPTITDINSWVSLLLNFLHPWCLASCCSQTSSPPRGWTP